MCIREGDPLEIYTDGNRICFQKCDLASMREQDAQHWLEVNKDFIHRSGARFTIEDATTVCECILNGKRVVGSAKCNPEDGFSPSVGMVYAFCRATNIQIPNGLD